MADINQIIDQKTLTYFRDLNAEIIKFAVTIDNTIPPLNKLSEAQSKITKTSKDQTEQEKQLIEQQKQADAINKQILTTDAKINALISEDGKLLTEKRLKLQQVTQAQKDKKKVDDAAEGSLVRMRAKLKELTAEYDKAGTRTKAATKEINDLSREIGEAEAATNRHQRGVGGYADQLGNLPGALGNVTASLAATGKAMWALVANPIGAVIAAITLAVTGLYKAFTSTDSGANKLQGTFKAIGNVIDILLDRLKSFIDLSISIATLDWEGIKKNGKDTFGGLGKSIADAAGAGYNYVQVMDDISDREAAAQVRMSKLSAEIEELKNKSKQANLTTKEKIALEEQAMNKAVELAGIEKGFLLERTAAETSNLASKIQNGALTVKQKEEQLKKWLEYDDKTLKSAMENDKEFADFADKNEADFQALQKMKSEAFNKDKEFQTETRRLQTSFSSDKQKLIDEDTKRTKERTAAEKEAAEKQVKIEEDKIKAIIDSGKQLFDAEEKARAQKKAAQIKTDEEEKARIKEKDDFELSQMEKALAQSQEKVDNAEKEAYELVRIEQEKADNIADIALSLGDILGDFASGQIKTFKDLSKELLLLALSAAQKQIMISQVEMLAKDIATKGFAGIAFTSAKIAIIQAAFTGVKGLIQGFEKGTDFAPAGVAMVAERGRELIQRPNGQIFLANNPALVNLERGSKVINNSKTEAYLNDGNIVSELRQTRKAIQRMPQPIFKNGSKIAERRGNYWKEYLQNKHRLN